MDRSKLNEIVSHFRATEEIRKELIVACKDKAQERDGAEDSYVHYVEED